MFVGIHPYKGQHPTLKGFEARMKANASVLGPDVKVPGLNFVCLESGVCVEITEEDQLEVWSYLHPSRARQQVASLGNDMRLIHHKGGVGGIRGQSVYSLRMK